MRGGSTAAMHRVTLELRSGATTTVVLRRYVLDHILTEEPGIAGYEAGVLQAMAALPEPTPELLACDSDGSQAGAPALVTSLLPGRPRWEDLRPRELGRLAEAMVAIAELTPPEPPLRPYRNYTQNGWEPPRWTDEPALWERAVELYHRPPPTHDVTVIHRDFHPGNVLWVRGSLTGIVDWQAAAVGPRSIDPGHCRLNLLFSDRGQADHLKDVWERLSGRTYDPWADVACIVGVLDLLRTGRTSTARLAIEGALRRAVADLSPAEA